MKNLCFLLLTVLFASNGLKAQPPSVPAKKGSSFGEKITAVDAVSTNDIAKALQDKPAAEVKVKGVVQNVCTAKGCFFYLKTNTGKMYIKTKDDSFFVPVALNGKTVVIKGTASKDKEGKEISIQATGVLVI